MSGSRIIQLAVESSIRTATRNKRYGALKVLSEVKEDFAHFGEKIDELCLNFMHRVPFDTNMMTESEKKAVKGKECSISISDMKKYVKEYKDSMDEYLSRVRRMGIRKDTLEEKKECLVWLMLSQLKIKFDKEVHPIFEAYVDAYYNRLPCIIVRSLQACAKLVPGGLVSACEESLVKDFEDKGLSFATPNAQYEYFDIRKMNQEIIDFFKSDGKSDEESLSSAQHTADLKSPWLSPQTQIKERESWTVRFMQIKDESKIKKGQYFHVKEPLDYTFIYKHDNMLVVLCSTDIEIIAGYRRTFEDDDKWEKLFVRTEKEDGRPSSIMLPMEFLFVHLREKE